MGFESFNMFFLWLSDVFLFFKMTYIDVFNSKLRSILFHSLGSCGLIWRNSKPKIWRSYISTLWSKRVVHDLHMLYRIFHTLTLKPSLLFQSLTLFAFVLNSAPWSRVSMNFNGFLPISPPNLSKSSRPSKHHGKNKIKRPTFQKNRTKDKDYVPLSIGIFWGFDLLPSSGQINLPWFRWLPVVCFGKHLVETSMAPSRTFLSTS